MPFFATAYDTTAARGTSIARLLVGPIQQALIRENFAIVNNQQLGIEMAIPQDGCVPTLITTQTDGEMALPLFAHPLYVDLSQVRKSPVENYMVSDARTFMAARPTDRDGRLVVKNKTEFDFTKNRTILSSLWYKHQTASFQHLSPALVAIYAAWISETITRRFGLDARDQQRIAVLAAYHYQSLFYTYSKFDENDIVKIATVVSRATYADIEGVLEILEAHPTMNGLDDLCSHIKTATVNPRLDDLSPGLLVAMIAISWFGTNAREISSVALEHVPTFVMLVYSAFNDRTYKLAAISKITERFKGRKGEDQLVASLKSLLEQQKNT